MTVIWRFNEISSRDLHIFFQLHTYFSFTGNVDIVFSHAENIGLAPWDSLPLCPAGQVLDIINHIQDSGYSSCVEIISDPQGKIDASTCACTLLMDLEVLSNCRNHESYEISGLDLWYICNDTYGLNFTCTYYEIKCFRHFLWAYLAIGNINKWFHTFLNLVQNLCLQRNFSKNEHHIWVPAGQQDRR